MTNGVEKFLLSSCSLIFHLKGKKLNEFNDQCVCGGGSCSHIVQ